MRNNYSRSCACGSLNLRSRIRQAFDTQVQRATSLCKNAVVFAFIIAFIFLLISFAVQQVNALNKMKSLLKQQLGNLHLNNCA